MVGCLRLGRLPLFLHERLLAVAQGIHRGDRLAPVVLSLAVDELPLDLRFKQLQICFRLVIDHVLVPVALGLLGVVEANIALMQLGL